MLLEPEIIAFFRHFALIIFDTLPIIILEFQVQNKSLFIISQSFVQVNEYIINFALFFVFTLIIGIRIIADIFVVVVAA